MFTVFEHKGLFYIWGPSGYLMNGCKFTIFTSRDSASAVAWHHNYAVERMS